MTELVLSLFTGAGLLDRGFEHSGFCVVSAGDRLWGRDVRDFTPPRHAFTGIIGGPPCQDFSYARRCPPTGYGVEMMGEFVRVVLAAEPLWFLCENVPGAPDLHVPGYSVQRFNLNANECRCPQNRLRKIQFGQRDGLPMVLTRCFTLRISEPCAMASEGRRKERRSWEDFVALQGLTRDFDLPGLSRSLKYQLVGNGVPLQMGIMLAEAIRDRTSSHVLLCACGCARPVRVGKTLAEVSCRKRVQRKRDAAPKNDPISVNPELRFNPML
jgi:DNA (cytosine-5)-methyltransferase 1